MTNDATEYINEIKHGFESLNREFHTTHVVTIDTEQITKEITEKLKRELHGRSSYGLGI